MKPIVLSPYMANVNTAVKDAQLRVMNKLCVDIPFVQVLTNRPHGKTLDGLLHTSIGKGYDTVLFMDIDAIPLSSYAIEHTLIKAHKGILTGNIQRSNHINNDQHLFVAPSFMAINIDKWIALGRPSFAETARGDVAEEVTYAWQDKGWQTQMYMPVSYEASPVESPSWALADGMPHYGLGTTFANGNKPMSYHAFQIRMGGMVERFLSKCDAVLDDKQK